MTIATRPAPDAAVPQPHLTGTGWVLTAVKRSRFLRWPKALAVALLMVVLSAATCGLEGTTSLPPPDLTKMDTLGAGDVVEVRVFNEQELSGTHQISEGGTITLPLVGVLVAEGLSPDELAVSIAGAYNARYLKRAEVSLLVKERNSQKVFVLGSVNKPGAVTIVGGRMTVVAAVAAAGGPSKLADGARVVLTREHDGKQLRVAVDVNAITKGAAPDVELQPGDILFVPESLF